MKIFAIIVPLFFAAMIFSGCGSVIPKTELSKIHPILPPGKTQLSLDDCLKLLPPETSREMLADNYYELAKFQQLISIAQPAVDTLQKELRTLPASSPLHDRAYALNKRLIELISQQYDAAILLSAQMNYAPAPRMKLSFSFKEILPPPAFPTLTALKKITLYRIGDYDEEDFPARSRQALVQLHKLHSAYLRYYEECRNAHLFIRDLPAEGNSTEENLLLLLRRTEARMDLISSRYSLHAVCRRTAAFIGAKKLSPAEVEKLIKASSEFIR